MLRGYLFQGVCFFGRVNFSLRRIKNTGNTPKKYIETYKV